jgi:hypothetical protein
LNSAGSVLALVLVEWTAGWIGVSAWCQSWKVVKRGHFRITAWIVAILGVLALVSNRSAFEEVADRDLQSFLVVALAVGAIAYLVGQYATGDMPSVLLGAGAAGVGVVALVLTGSILDGWPAYLAAAELIAGGLLLGGVTNGMMLGHWYLNQPGLKPWALARLTQLTLVAAIATGILGLVGVTRLTDAATSGAVLGLPGFGESFGLAFYLVWLVLLAFTVVAVMAARKCIKIRSIQSATGLYYVALLTAGVSEFLIRYLMVNAA